MQTALFRGVAVVLALAATMPVNVQAAPLIRQQTRCGWIDNPTPANWWLTDGYGEWIIGVQGGRQAEGMDNLPDFSSSWVETNGHYGYGCGCITADVDVHEKRFVRIYSVKQKKISACKHDKALPPRG